MSAAVEIASHLAGDVLGRVLVNTAYTIFQICAALFAFAEALEGEVCESESVVCDSTIKGDNIEDTVLFYVVVLFIVLVESKLLQMLYNRYPQV
mgnify:CR=1 FL=1